MLFKEKLKALKNSQNAFARMVFALLKTTRHTYLFITNGRYQSEYRARLNNQSNYYQHSVQTTLNRYPLLFKQCALYLQDNPTPKILSFGCSTGAEVYSLSTYMPQANITGIDINDWCLKQCRKKYKATNFSFYNRLSPEFANMDSFDAIFAMAVFQRTENRTETQSTVQGISFEQFELEINTLDAKLKPGGLFIIDHADFDFADVDCSKNYTPLDFEGNKIPRNRPLFNRNNLKIADSQVSSRVFVKLAN